MDWIAAVAGLMLAVTGFVLGRLSKRAEIEDYRETNEALMQSLWALQKLLRESQPKQKRGAGGRFLKKDETNV